MIIFLLLMSMFNLLAITENEKKNEYIQAVVSGDVTRIQKSIDSLGINALLDANNNTPLHYAAQNGDAQTVQFLIEKGADVNAKNGSEKTPLQEAERFEFFFMEHYLNGSNPLHWAIYDNKKLIDIEELIKKNKNWLNLVDKNKNTPLHIAVKYSDIPVIKLLVASGSSLQAINKFGRNPLQEAENLKRNELLIYLSSNNPLQWMILEGKPSRDIEKAINTYTEFINQQDADGNTVLHLAVKYNLPSVIKALIVTGADINIKNKKGNTPLDEALLSKHSDSLSKYLNGSTPLHWAIYDAKSLSEIQQILEDNKNWINKADQDGVTPLHVAALKDRADVIELLMSKGADSTALDKWGSTPATIAPRYFREIVKPFNQEMLRAFAGDLALIVGLRG